MSSERGSRDSVHTESSEKLQVLVVAEGDTKSYQRSSRSNICGTLETHQTPRRDETSGAEVPSTLMRWSSWDGGPRRVPSDESVVFDGERARTSTRASWRGGEAGMSGSSAAEASARRGAQGLPRSRTWCAELLDDGDGGSEVRILRERLVRTQSRPQPATVRLLSRRQRLTLASLALVDFMSFCSMSIMAPFFPREASEKGMSDTVSGFVFSFYALVMFLSSPVFGKILPVIGAKFMFMSGMFVAGSCNILFGTLELMHDRQVFTVFCFVIRGLEALGASAYSTASYVFVVNTFPTNIGSVLGILETFVGLGMSVGPAIGGLLYAIGGFGLPFYVLGILMVFAVPINCCLLVDDMEYTLSTKSGSMLQLLKIPSIIITGLVIVIVSNIWAFLDPTLEPHLRQYALSTQQIGLIFLLFSALYGISSPIWGWIADRVDNHWCMMVWGLLLCTLGLLLLGPSPFLPVLQSVLWLDLVALSILGISVALTLLPTFQGVLSSSIYEGGCPEALATYSMVAGVWSCCYSLGEVLGPAMGGALTSYYGFPLCTTIMAAACFAMAVITLTFFSLKESSKLAQCSDSLSGSLPYSDATWDSNDLSISCGTDPLLYHETSPLTAKDYSTYGSTHAGNNRRVDTEHRKKWSGGGGGGGASVAEALAYVLMFRFVTESMSRSVRPACMRAAAATAPTAAFTSASAANAACNKHAALRATTAC